MSKLPSVSTSLRQLKNSFAPVNRLPPEVLGLIQTFRKSERDLISAPAACAYWRRTLTSTPNLWNKIICSERENSEVVAPRIQAYLGRSRSIPVEVRIHAHSSRLLSSDTERISSLRMILDHPSNLDEIEKHLSKPAPILGAVSFHVEDWDQPTLVLPPAFFEEFLSSVRALDLYGVTLPLGPCKLSGLTKFTLSMRATSVSSIVLLDALEQMPSLRVFEVRLDYASRQDPVPIDYAIILPHLEEVATTRDDRFDPPHADTILPSLCLPSARRVSVRLINASGFPGSSILPLSFEERLPSFSVTPKVSVTFDGGVNIEFFGLQNSRLALSMDPFIDYPFTRLTFGAAPFSSVHKLHVRFQGLTRP